MENDRPPILDVVGHTSGKIRLTLCENTQKVTIQPQIRTIKEWARDGDGDGIREVHYNTMVVESSVATQFRDWDKKNRYLFYRRATEILEIIPNEGLLLDIGCGDAEMMEYLKAHKPGLQCYGIDIRENLSGANILKASCSSIPFKNNKFDIIIMAAVIEHIENQEAVIHDISYVLKENGIVIITTPNPLYSIFARIAAKLGLKYKEGYDNSISLKKIKKMLQENGFIIKTSRGFLIIPFRINIIEKLEKLFKNPNSDFTFLMNQIVVGAKRSDKKLQS